MLRQIAGCRATVECAHPKIPTGTLPSPFWHTTPAFNQCLRLATVSLTTDHCRLRATRYQRNSNRRQLSTLPPQESGCPQGDKIKKTLVSEGRFWRERRTFADRVVQNICNTSDANSHAMTLTCGFGGD